MSQYYIASPGFNQSQLDRIKEVEKLLTDKAKPFYSPFTHGGKLNLTDDKEINKATVKLFFDENVNEIDERSNLIAIVGDDDKGTNFEIGYKVGRLGLQELEVTKYVTLVDDVDGRISDAIRLAIKKTRSIVESGVRAYVMDITKKSTIDYLMFGMLFACGIEVITWSNVVLDSNLMTACSTSLHYQNGEDGNLSCSELQTLFIEDRDAFEELFKAKRYNLSNMKFKKKME